MKTSPLSCVLQGLTSRPLFTADQNSVSGVSNALAEACKKAGLNDHFAKLASSSYGDRVEALHTLSESPELHLILSGNLIRQGHLTLRNAARLMEADFQGRASQPSKFVLLGDIHGEWDIVRKIIAHECPYGNGAVLSTGDLETYETISEGPPFLFIHGNHDPLRGYEALDPAPPPGVPRPLRAGDWMILLGGLTVGGLPGTFSARHSVSHEARVFPYFNRTDCHATADIPVPLTFFMSHEAPYGIGVTKSGRDVGIRFVSYLIQRLRPAVSFFGHHHMDFDGEFESTKVIGLNRPSRSYVTAVLDPNDGTLTLRRHQSDGHFKPTLVCSIDMAGRKTSEEISQWIDAKFRAEVLESLLPAFLSRMEGQTERERTLKAKSLAGALINTALPYVAEYLSVAKTPVTSKESALLKEKILTRIKADQPDYAHADILRVFDELSQKALAKG